MQLLNTIAASKKAHEFRWNGRIGGQALSKEAFAESLGLADVPDLGAAWEARIC